MNAKPTLKNPPVLPDVLNAIPHGIALLDTNLCIVMMNRFLEGMIGYLTEEVKGIYGEFILRSNLGSKNLVCKKVLESGEAVSSDGNILNRQRKKIPIHFTHSRLHDEQQQPIGVLIVFEDSSITKTESATQQDDSVRARILGHSPKMEKVFELMSVLARTDASVLITGETGTGKDMIAEALHKTSQRARQPFIKVNCGALPEALLESELFGHVKGAFTGAVNESAGMFRLADKGTLFLTEIGDLSLPLQVKLLSVLDDREFFPVGGSKKVKVDVRIIAATHRSLRKEVQSGNFREDLFYRLNVLHLHMPSLCERDGDIRLLLDHFLRHFSTKLGRELTGFSKNAIEFLNQYPYPGNVRELRNIVEYSANICQQSVIDVKDLPLYLLSPADTESKVSAQSAPPVFTDDIVEETKPKIQKPASSKAGSWSEVEKELILETLRTTAGNRSKAAENLGWGRTTLWRKLKKYQIA